MKTVQNTETVTIKVRKSDLIEGKWLNWQLLSRKLAEMEQERNLGYKSLRSRLYNSTSCGKYNTSPKAGLRCIDVEKPMQGKASLEFIFEIVEE